MTGAWARTVAWAATSRGAATANALVAAMLVLGALVAYVAFWLEDRANPPTCYGIGWGCTPDPATGLLLVVVFFGVPALAVSTVLIWGGHFVAAKTEGGWQHAGAVAVLLPVVAHAVALTVLEVAVATWVPGWMAELG